ncbi:efflux RND transporter periplasmic adaptor subunit [Fulvivirga sp. M361]|uniref:efflux RND transporter periplasmic adaptor subunit n=1 Tax=Fulvivirga sp. M361 TaxID=2594266 RepID=UPI00117B3C84|nr:efflux RND transporter periplasmic adaptor subunit [Fulvivirga sp. M361]TRX61863.1 efflux RND transporter periplasmic adaptor subunit [Fulvivirga sp. M361]
MKKHNYSLVLFAVIILFTGCNEGKENTLQDSSSLIAVNVSSVGQSPEVSYFTGSGKIEAMNSANLSTRVMGLVDRLHVKVGEAVKKGQVLVVLNNADLQAQLAQANASIAEASVAFNNAEKDHNRFKNLFADNSATQKELDDMAAHFEMARARLEAARQLKNEIVAQFSYTNIKAPFDGVVTHKFIEAGDMTNPGMSLLSIESTHHFHVMAMVPESEIAGVQTGGQVTVTIKSIDKMMKGKVTEVSASAKNTGGQYLVKVVMEEFDSQVRSGMFASVDFPVERVTSSVPMISKAALVRHGQLTGVYTVSESNTAMLRWLRLGHMDGDEVEVLSGLRSDEQYILSAEGKLYNGAKITIQ